MGHCSSVASHCGKLCDDAEEIRAARPGQVQAPRRLKIAVMRHGERADQANPRMWFRSMLGRRYPFDPPLTMAGTKQARSAAKELFAKYNGDFSLVVSSPFIRCIETAVEVCRVFNCALCIDRQLGEVFCPAYFGAWEAPGPAIRSAEEVSAYVPNDVRLVGVDDDGNLSASGFIGARPTWPEKNGKLRLASRVEQLTEKAVKLGGASFILVTHGDCVAGCLALGLTSARKELTSPTVSKVPYCGFVVLERPFQIEEEPRGLLDIDAGWSIFNGHNEVVDPGSPEMALWTPLQERKAEHLQHVARDLAQLREEAESPLKRMQRRQTTMILCSEILSAKAQKLLATQHEAGLRFNQLVPEFPMDKRLTGESLGDLANFARAEALEV
ncbi:unnamed protein product [Effrenium voratum]|nr:unnamed protein product [Effrenium voratum]CAJ1428869.1 unnamed protein product [Effrenium voratum]|mmetsp:Transcript_96068/g.228777  ORF Transcript_96068/g.228777 Transcript_96068/m.228777 type:complete len:385 (-) Transcript_96068:47-1201(-)